MINKQFKTKVEKWPALGRKVTLQEVLDGIFASDDEDYSCDGNSEEEEDVWQDLFVLNVYNNDNVRICDGGPQPRGSS